MSASVGAVLYVAGPRGNKAQARSHAAATRKGNGPANPPTILVVEDEVLIRLAVAEFLRECGYRIFEASNAAEAQRVLAAEETAVDVVFSDVNMPGEMDGLGLAKWVKQEFPHIKVILASGVSRIVHEAKDLCADGPLIEKPYRYEALAAHIKKLLGG